VNARLAFWIIFAASGAAAVLFAPAGDDIIEPIRAPQTGSSAPPQKADAAQPSSPRTASAASGHLAYVLPAPLPVSVGKLAEAAGGLLPPVPPAPVDRAPRAAESPAPPGPEQSVKAFGRMQIDGRWMVALAVADEEGLAEVDGQFAGRFRVIRIDADRVVLRTEPDGRQFVVAFAEAR
jgi:hypothetical protein